MKRYLLAALLACSLFVSAQEEGLYAPAPPADAAFVRVLNAAESDVTSSLGGTSFGALIHGAVSPYRVVPQGAAELSAGNVTETLELAAGRFYTVVLDGYRYACGGPDLGEPRPGALGAL